MDLDVTLYDMNKQLINKRNSIDELELKQAIADISNWFSYEQDHYFMLLCHERRDYTLFRFMDSSKRCYEGGQELLSILKERGEILDIGYEERSYPIWIRIDGESFLYHLFPYDAGVIEV